jgi:hypothetical protein
MPAMTNLLVKDDAASPKEWTLVPVTDTPNPSWRANDTTLPLEAQPRFTETVERLKSGSYKITAKLELPVLETLGASGTSLGYVAPPKVAYVTTCIFTMFADGRSTAIDRANALKMIVGLLQGSSSTTATGVLNQASAGSAFASSVLPITQSVVAVLLPN